MTTVLLINANLCHQVSDVENRRKLNCGIKISRTGKLL